KRDCSSAVCPSDLSSHRWGCRAIKGGKAAHYTYKGKKATDTALNAYQMGRTLDNLRKAEYGLYGITSANGLGEYVTGRDMFGNELSEEKREQSLNEALALLGGIAAGVGLKKVNPTVHLGQVNRSVKKAEGKGHVEQTYKRSSGFRKGV